MKSINAVLLLAILGVAKASGGGGGTSACTTAALEKYWANEVKAWDVACGTKDLQPAKSGQEDPPSETACCTPKATTRCKTTVESMTWATQFLPKKSETEGNAVCSTECTQAVQKLAWNPCFWSNWAAINPHTGKVVPDCCPEDGCQPNDETLEARAKAHDATRCYFKADSCIPQAQINAWANAGGVLGPLNGGCMRGVNWGLTIATVFGSMCAGMLLTALIGQISMWRILSKKGDEKADPLIGGGQADDDDITADDADAVPME